ncbi:MAG: TonB-dependent receptor [Alphaproteobacteria bacterium]|nr:TonB-dependent receptor [Alphaproteobacteria bacterium]
MAGAGGKASGDDVARVFHIPSKPIADALVDFAVQAELSISDSGVDVGGAASNPIDGRFTPEAALQRLLAGSGLTFHLVDRNSVQITAQDRRFAAFPEHGTTERVVVTASKIHEVAESAPRSVAIADGTRMQLFNVKTAQDLTSEVAGLTATNLGPGEDKLFVRGLTDSVLPGLSQSVVNLYLDDSPIASDAPDPNLRLVDVERVEVLRGPQGSLYGAGALTGLVRIVTREPLFDRVELIAGGDASLTFGGVPSASAEAILNLPLLDDQFAVRLVGYADDLGGYVDELRLHRKDTNDARIAGLRTAAAWQLTAGWTLSTHLSYQRTRSGDSQYYDQDLGANRRDNYLSEPHSDDFLLASVSAEDSFGGLSLESTSSFVDRNFGERFDASLAWPELTGLPFGPAPFDYARGIRAFSHETRLSSTHAGRWQWLAGIFLSHEDEDLSSRLVGPGPAHTAVDGRSELRNDRTNEAALFGQATYNLSDQFSISAGARAFDASHNVSAETEGVLAGTPQFHGNSSQTGFAPQASLAYRPNYDTTFYASYSQGYRLGGLNVDGPPGASGDADPSFDSDVLRNYEIGAKVRLFDGRAVANTAVYFAEWRNVQTDQIAPDGAFYILNAGNVRDLGFEAEGSGEVLPSLHLSGNVFWSDAGLSNTNPLLVTTEGNLPGAPAITFGLSARYDRELASNLNAFAEFGYNYVGSSHLGFNDATPAMGNYQLISVRLGLVEGCWQGILFAENLTNDRGNTFAFGNPFTLPFERQITPPRPRTIGLSFSWAAEPRD